MPKIKAVGKLVNTGGNESPDWSIWIINQNRLIQDLVNKLVKSDTVRDVHLEIEFKSTYQEKTHSQLGYMHAAIWPQFYRFYEQQGIPAETIEQKERIRNDVKFTIGFISLEKTPMGNNNTKGNGYTREHPRSFAGASKEETSEMIERLLVLAADFGILIEGPEEYMEKLNLEELV